MSEEKISRRKFLYAGLGAIAGLVVGAAAGYMAKPTAPPTTRTVTKTVTSTVTATATPTVTTTTTPTTTTTTPTTTTTTPTVTKTKRTGEITVLSVQDPFFFALEGLIPEFEEEYGIKVNFMGVAYDELHAKLVNSFLAKEAGVVDVACVDQMWVAEYADAGWIISLDELIERDKKEVNLMDFIPSAIYSLCEWRGHIWTLPIAPYNQGVLYRVDVFDELGIEHPPTDPAKSEDWTWDKYMDIVKQINGKEIGGTKYYGTVICGAQPEPIVHMYTQLAASKGARWFKKFPEAPWDFTPLLNSEENVNALKFYKELYANSPPESINYVWFDAGTQFGKGNIGIMYWWSPYFYLVTKAGYMVKEDSPLGIDGKPNWDKYRCALLPRDPNFPQVISVGGWSFGIASTSNMKEEAWEFIKWATSPKTLKKMGLMQKPAPYQYSDFPRISIYSDKQLNEIYPYLPLQLKLFEGWETPYKCIPSGKIVRPTVPIYVTLEGFYGLYLNKAVAGEMSPKDALDTANNMIEMTLKKNMYIPYKIESYNDTLENCIKLMKELS